MSLASLRDWLAKAPPGTMVPAAAVLEQLDASEPPAPLRTPDPARASAWRERFWTCPPETRIGVVELAEAIGRTKSWVYRHTSAKGGYSIIPHAKLDGELIFVVGAVRAWLEAYERGEIPHELAPATPASKVIALGERATRRRP